ncbi:MAG: lysophospholipid acyltransferase family protein [Candidatus Dormibacteria bacterium]
MLYVAVQAVVRLVLGIFFRVDVTGRENVPETGCLVVSNHLSWTDTIFIMYALPKRPRTWTMANESTVFNTRFKRWLMPRLCVFPIRRNRGMLDQRAVDRVYGLLESGQRVLIFPEGAYGRDGELRPLKDGVGYFALNSGKPLLPVSLRGTGRLRPFSRVTVDIGVPFVPDPPRVLELRLRVAATVAAVRTRLADLGRRATAVRGRRLPFLRSAGGGEPARIKRDQAEVQNRQPDRDGGHADDADERRTQ